MDRRVQNASELSKKVKTGLHHAQKTRRKIYWSRVVRAKFAKKIPQQNKVL